MSYKTTTWTVAAATAWVSVTLGPIAYSVYRASTYTTAVMTPDPEYGYYWAKGHLVDRHGNPMPPITDGGWGYLNIPE